MDMTARELIWIELLCIPSKRITSELLENGLFFMVTYDTCYPEATCALLFASLNNKR